MSEKLYESWGRNPKPNNQKVIVLSWRNELPNIKKLDRPVLPFGLGKSYGDSCLNENGYLIDCSLLNHFINFDVETGLLCVESGVTLKQIIDFVLPRGWFLPVTPGTKLITVGGAIANDVHGKNHHKAGTFGCHLVKFELYRNDEYVCCSKNENPELFSATIGGLGLTGLITWAEIQLIKCPSEFIDSVNIKFSGIDDFFEINTELETNYDYTVSWVDCSAEGKNLGRGIYNAGNFYDSKDYNDIHVESKAITYPVELPLINKVTVSLFNQLYYHKQFEEVNKQIVHYNGFFYPLDAVYKWNQVYGREGFYQYQFVIPMDNGKEVIKDILGIISNSGLSSFLVVLKTFGDIKSPGMLSFPRKGITMAVDFKNYGDKTLKLLNILDNIVRNNGGVLYPAKDARMNSNDFKEFYPKWSEFSRFIDHNFSSDFWRRVTNNEG